MKQSNGIFQGNHDVEDTATEMMKKMFTKAPEIKSYEDVDEYLKELNNQVINNEKAKQELDNMDYDIWFSKQQE